MPANTHPKQVSNTDGVPEGSNRRPLSTARLKTPATSCKSTFPGVPKSESANEMFIRCFHLRLKAIRCDGRTDVILGSTKASTSRVFSSLPKLVILCNGSTIVCRKLQDVVKMCLICYLCVYQELHFAAYIYSCVLSYS